jgi:hypothetical protein
VTKLERRFAIVAEGRSSFNDDATSAGSRKMQKRGLGEPTKAVSRPVTNEAMLGAGPCRYPGA